MTKSLKGLFIAVMIAILATSCSLLGQNTPSPASGTPNATLTALFDLSHNPAKTAQPGISTLTSEPVLPTVSASTAVPPTSAPTVALPTTAQANPTSASMERTGPLMKAAFLSTAPVMDGSWSDWIDKTTQYPIKYVVWGAKNWTGQEDLQAAFGSGWDDKNLYLGFKAYDDKYVQNTSGKEMYKGDSLEILIDTNLDGDFYSQQLSSDDYQLGISYGNADKGIKPEAYLWFPSNVEGTRTQVGIAYVFEAGLYRAEVAIPWSTLGITPTSGMTIGFSASVNDNDDASQNLQQTMVSSSADRVLTDPTTWGSLTLVK